MPAVIAAEAVRQAHGPEQSGPCPPEGGRYVLPWHL